MKKQKFDHFATFVFAANKEYNTMELEKFLRLAIRSLPKRKRGSIKPSSLAVDTVKVEEV